MSKGAEERNQYKTAGGPESYSLAWDMAYKQAFTKI